jgi:hypothetical protein
LPAAVGARPELNPATKCDHLPLFSRVVYLADMDDAADQAPVLVVVDVP